MAAVKSLRFEPFALVSNSLVKVTKSLPTLDWLSDEHTSVSYIFKRDGEMTETEWKVKEAEA